jgi:hypothetical protein
MLLKRLCPLVGKSKVKGYRGYRLSRVAEDEGNFSERMA